MKPLNDMNFLTAKQALNELERLGEIRHGFRAQSRAAIDAVSRHWHDRDRFVDESVARLDREMRRAVEQQLRRVSDALGLHMPNDARVIAEVGGVQLVETPPFDIVTEQRDLS